MLSISDLLRLPIATAIFVILEYISLFTCDTFTILHSLPSGLYFFYFIVGTISTSNLVGYNISISKIRLEIQNTWVVKWLKYMTSLKF